MVRCTPSVRCTWIGHHHQVQRTLGVHRTEPAGSFRFMIDKIGKFRCVIAGFCNMK
jgi:hypothetical protein